LKLDEIYALEGSVFQPATTLVGKVVSSD
jgi:hypothetical protein